MKKMFFALIGCFVAICAHAAQVVNVDYIHKLIQQEWDVTVPIRTDNVMAAANMKYLLTAIDVANQILNGEKTTDYGNSEFATLQVADTIATNQAVETLIKQNQIEYKFSVTIDIGKANKDCLVFGGEKEMTSEHGISLSAAGTFYIDWGDGTTETIKKTDTEETYYLHDYGTKSGVFTIRIGGKATDYNDDGFATIGFTTGDTMCAIINHGISSIDGSLGAIFSTLPDGSQPRFSGLFEGCGLTSIPENLFAGISGTPASYMFDGTFADCGGLTSIPAGLFAGMSGAPAEAMFQATFSYCTGLTSIPADLFAGISGAPASFMFAYTFSHCTDLTSIPSDLFAGISGKPAESMFEGTFSYCSGLTGAIPDGLFGNLSGAPASYMFNRTFCNCSGLTSIPENLFGNISGTAQNYMFSNTFENCTSLTGPSARINGQYLYEIWPNATEDQAGYMYEYATGLDDYRCIPSVWGGGGENCSAPTAEFTLTTTSTNSFSFSISAAGEFVVDWGDGTVETITKPDTTDTIYSHNYSTAGAYTIGLSGQATAYNTDEYTAEYTAAISFYLDYSDTQSKKIASIDGSLGAIFGTLSSDTNNQPRFYRTFYSASNMKGAIPENLFAGISGAPASDMFHSTFEGCTGLTSIPDGLFAGISGAPAESMFYGTFQGCSGLTSIPDGLFAGISGAPAEYMFAYTFNGCSGLTGAIPDGLFAGISGAPAINMFSDTFSGCSGLTSIPENLFGNISGPTHDNMFVSMFDSCTSLTGPSARINGKYLYEIWPNLGFYYVKGPYYGCTGLSDYSTMPAAWRSYND